MRNALRFLLVLTLGLGALSLSGYFVLERTTRRWFASDVTLRSQLAVAASRQSLVESIVSRTGQLERVLSDITHDDRIMGAAVCSNERTLIAATDAFPKEFACASIDDRFQHGGHTPVSATKALIAELPSGRVQLSGTPLESDGRSLGTVLLVHDLSFLTRRVATARNLSILAFFLLSLGASLVTMIAMRVAWRGWLAEFRDALAGMTKSKFRPLVRDVRELVAQLVAERSTEGQVGPWSPDRLRATLTKHLHGERVIILTNREPYVHEHGPEGIRVLHPASGLVTALEPVMRACSGVWVAPINQRFAQAVVDESDTDDPIVFVQDYRQLGQRVDSLARAINAKWFDLPVPPITLLRSHHEPPEVFKLFRATDVCYLSSLHDGMNLVAKEFVAARDDEQGVLVLSQFTGAARDLTESLIVNPYDIRQVGDALVVALTMPEAEQRERMRSMRRLIAQFNVYRWAGRILVDAAEVRRRDRMTNRLSTFQPPISSALA